jgi:hypothetical protein
VGGHRVTGRHPDGVTTAHPAAAHGRRVTRRRKWGVYALVGVATVLLIVSSLTVWAKRQLLDTDAWTKASGQVLADPQVRSALSTKLVDLLYQREDVSAAVAAKLPKAAQPAAPAIAAALQTAAVRAVDALLSTSKAQQLWENANRRAHTALVNVLEGKKVRRLTTSNGTVALDLSPLLDKISSRLGVSGSPKSGSSTSGQIVLLKSDQLKTAQDGFKVLKALSTLLVFLVLALYAVAIYLARGSRLFVLEVSGATIVFSGLIVLIARRVLGNYVVDSLVKTDANKVPVHHVWLILTALLGDIGIVLIVYGILAMIAGWLGGGSRPAVAVRRFLAPTFRDRPIVVWAGALLLFLLFLAWGPGVGGRRALGTIVLAALIGLGIELWRRQTLREFPEPPAPV